MSKTSPTRTTSSTTEKPVTRTLEEAVETGYLGSVPDQTPNENYTLAGVIANKPTPENQRRPADAGIVTTAGVPLGGASSPEPPETAGT